ncbi:hypothetical protein Q4534_07150 [Cyclobacterium sp. 1_MG-2023]|uniref:hypothetical protein n=1 Tax=Cyclobacterium sp. 1_MG-2023 TaxID=3062681 RepID=UPI0026E17581|nr:hypothetical protein [Cyclobacterium sp. 1_MG-2023]MDO6437174.1 hypothetical protein [Cyclobacterium sp. 1_MG-2023]
MSYRNLIENNPLLIKHWEEENYLFIPLYKLATKVQEKVVQFMDYEYESNNCYGFTNDPNKYVPLGEKDKVSQECRDFLIYLLTDKNPEDYPFTNDSNRACYHFWHGARKGKFREIKPGKQPQFPTIEFLDQVSILVEYKSFNSFIRKYFSASEKIKVILLPFLDPYSPTPIVVDLLEYELNLLQKESLLNLEIIKQAPLNEEKIGWKNAKEIGKTYHADLVIWGRLDHNNQIHLSSYALKPEICYFWESNTHGPITFNLNSFHVEFLEPIKNIFLWTTAIRLSLRKDDRRSINIFSKLLNSNFRLLEVNLCLSVIYYYKKYTKYVDHHVISTISLALGRSYEETKLKMKRENPMDHQNGSIIHQLVSKWNLSRENRIINENLDENKPGRIIFFEYIAAVILLGYKNLFSPEEYEKFLTKIFNKIQLFWFKSEYAEVFGSIYFEMGMVKEKKLTKKFNIGPEDVYKLYKTATLHSNNIHIHKTCIEFYIKYEQFDKIRTKILSDNKHSDEVLALYK